MILELLTATLAALWGWEALRVICPWSLPSQLQPLIVLAISAALCWPDWHLAMAVAGATGVLHATLTDKFADTKPSVSIRRGVGGRVPPLP